MRPVFELMCGRFSLRERVVRSHAPDEWGAVVRGALAETYREEHPAARVNDIEWIREESVLFINGRWLPAPGMLNHVNDREVGVIDGTVAWIVVHPDDTDLCIDGDWPSAIEQLATTRSPVEAGGNLVSRPWDLISWNGQQLAADFGQFARPTGCERGPQVALIGSPSDVCIAESARIDPFVVLDTTDGPITIDDEVHIQSFTRIEGPCHISAKTEVFRALIREGTTIGPNCRVGGEIEQSIFHGFSNKYHEGFIGHSYVCPWVNLGAMTTNSDLKNDYSPVKVPLAGESIDTGTTKVGCFIGDHTKTAIDSMFNTGSSIGVMAMVLPGGELLPKHIPSFMRIWFGKLDDTWDADRNIATARTAMNRRGAELTDAQERLIRQLYEQTRMERRNALDRAASKAAQTVAKSC